METKKKTKKDALTDESLMQKIHLIRGEKVMLDRDLAQLYGVETKVLKQQVRRNLERFPSDFLFTLNTKELNNLRSQFVTSSWGGLRHSPMAFTEQGVAMLSSVLGSPRAIQINIQIMRVFTRMRRLVEQHGELLQKLLEIEQRMDGQDEKIISLFEALRQLLSPPNLPRKKVGFTRQES